MIPTSYPTSDEMARLTAGMLIEIDFSLGIAWLRRGETQNCCLRNTPDSCLFPIRGTGIHTDREGSARAAEYFHKTECFCFNQQPLEGGASA